MAHNLKRIAHQVVQSAAKIEDWESKVTQAMRTITEFLLYADRQPGVPLGPFDLAEDARVDLSDQLKIILEALSNEGSSHAN